MDLRFISQQYGEQAKSKLIPNLIYQLETDSSVETLPGIQSISAPLQQTIDSAANMPITLWFTNDSQLDDLIVCGQASICYNLMRYIVRNYGEDVNSFPSDVKTLWDNLARDWDDLCNQPQILF